MKIEKMQITELTKHFIFIKRKCLIIDSSNSTIILILYPIKCNDMFGHSNCVLIHIYPTSFYCILINYFSTYSHLFMIIISSKNRLKLENDGPQYGLLKDCPHKFFDGVQASVPIPGALLHWVQAG